MAALTANQIRFLNLLIQREALLFGEFTLKSGRQSPYFINTGRCCAGSDIATLGECYAERIARAYPDAVDVIYGPAYKGIPLACAAAMALDGKLNRSIGWAFDRKEAKHYGDTGAFVGAPLVPGTKVILVDDVLTAGTALREALAKLRTTGVVIEAIVVSVDRQEEGRGPRRARDELEADYGVPVQSLLTMTEITEYLASDAAGDLRLADEQITAMRAHLRTVGALTDDA